MSGCKSGSALGVFTHLHLSAVATVRELQEGGTTCTPELLEDTSASWIVNAHKIPESG